MYGVTASRRERFRKGDGLLEIPTSSRYGVNNALIACPLPIVKPIRAADIARHPFVDEHDCR
jgi:hypothetical protein